MLVVRPTEPVIPTPTLAPNVPTLPPAAPESAAAEGSLQLTETEPVPTVTPLPTATPTPRPEERLSQAQIELDHGNFTRVIALLDGAELPPAEQRAARVLLGTAFLREGEFAAARQLFEELIAEADGEVPVDYYFFLGESATALAEWPAALAAFKAVHSRSPQLGAYVQPRLANIYFALGDAENGRLALQAALTAPANRLAYIDIHQRLASLALENGELLEAVTHYDAIHALAVTEFTRGQMTYLAGDAALQAGDTELAYARFQRGVAQYPGSYDSYLGLVQLVNAEQPVDDFQRGLVNLNAASYDPAIAAFERHLAANPDDAEAHRLLARTYTLIGNTEAALTALDEYARFAPAEAALARAVLLADEAALTLYRETAVAENGAAGAEAAFAAARLTETIESPTAALPAYLLVADRFPDSPQAAPALFRAGWLAYDTAESGETAITHWLRAARDYPDTEEGMAAGVWLQRTLADLEGMETESELDPETVRAELALVLDAAGGIDYFTLRAKALAEGQPPFVAANPFIIPAATAQLQLQEEADAWLRDRLGLAADTPVAELTPALAREPGLLVGTRLWQLGLFAEAKRELEAVRAAYWNDALESYQLALYFRELGLYRSSILAAERTMTLLDETPFTAPRFLGQLAYPVYYAELILPLAEQYGYDPRLQFSLVRQESLFESIATSSAAAQGLSQVIPDTGVYIAGLLAWPDYENADLYKPYVGLAFGAFYLQQQLGNFDGDVHAALSAYNAGPGNAARWHETAGSDLDWYVRTVNFPETELYIERIYAGFIIYDYLYQPAADE